MNSPLTTDYSDEKGVRAISTFLFGRYILGAVTVATMLAGCAGSAAVSPLTAPLVTHQPLHSLPTSRYKSLYSFKGPAKGDGATPEASLTELKGVFYGTTEQGGAYGCVANSGCGTIFEVSPSGRERVLYRFVGGLSDGESPRAGMATLNGAFYGTTYEGGEGTKCYGGCGTVFVARRDGTEGPLHMFREGKDGAYPVAGLIAASGKLYGTTYLGGGSHDGGTVFEISTTGKERVLHGFTGSPDDGASPLAGLIEIDGTLYGTTASGGNSCRQYSGGCGTVFELSTSGNGYKLLYRFNGYPYDGAMPQASLVAIDGKLYGTTIAGGTNNCGTVFVVSQTGRESVLYNFKGSRYGDGAIPQAGLIAVNGALYGTTSSGGSGGCYDGCGTVFMVSMTGKETVLHSFNGSPSGAGPEASLVAADGAMYGTTQRGGYDVGTIFRVSQ